MSLGNSVSFIDLSFMYQTTVQAPWHALGHIQASSTLIYKIFMYENSIEGFSIWEWFQTWDVALCAKREINQDYAF